MYIVLIFISFFSAIAAFKISGNESESSRSSFIKAAVIHGLVIAISTELLSLNKSLTLVSLVLLWSLMALINTTIFFKLIFLNKNSFNIADKISKKKADLKNLDNIDIFAISIVVLVLIICLVTALIAPPNNYDSMTYHMARVMHWIQNRSVSYYQTNNLRQISFPPGAAYIITHLQILSGGDRFANCVQWLAFLGSIIGTSLVVKSIGGINAQAITALVCASIPMAIMQSTTTQTDLVTTFWLVSFVYFIFRTDKYTKSDIFWLSASFALAILSKPTAIIFGIPFLIILAFRQFSGLRVNNFSKSIHDSILFNLAILIFTFSLSVPSYLRNQAVFGNILGIDTGTKNSILGINQLISNLLRNLALSLPFKGYWQLVENIHKLLNIDINNPATTFGDNKFNSNLSVQLLWLPDEDFVTNPIHFLLILIVIAFLVYIYIKQDKNKFAYLPITTATIIGFILYSWLLKWQIWANRLLLPLFILNAPTIGYFIKNYLSKAMQLSLSIILIFLAIIYSLTPVHHPLIALSSNYSQQSPPILTLKRDEIYFSGALKGVKDAYTILTNTIFKDNCQSIGIDIGENGPEYPLWVLIQSKNTKSFKIKHINVQNQSKILEPEFPDSQLCGTVEVKNNQITYLKVKRPS